MPNYQKKIISGNAGATLQTFNFEQIKKFDILLPNIELQYKFASFYIKIEKLKEKQKKSEQELNTLFNSLMQKSFKRDL